MKPKIPAEQIDALLPQTQCGLCTYQGCMPYAKALASEEAEINLCPPGGVQGLFALGKLLQKDPAPFIREMQKTAKPKMIAVIREDECIGCTKCIKACPVDAILGSGKQMHTVITSECTGCELCVAPCPVDCIDMLTLPSIESEQQKQESANHYRKRYHARNQRLENEKKLRQNKSIEKKKQNLTEKKSYVQAALLRAKAKNSK
jgi:electron transport complex protein RnfB